MSKWKSWNLKEWNRQLLEHFFRRRDGQTNPVVVLLVTAEELARSTGDQSAHPDEVRHTFVEVVRSELRQRSRSLLEDADNYLSRLGSLEVSWPPRFVAHLLFTCIAASESSTELAYERAYLARLRELADGQLSDQTLQVLPRLWERLASWLKANERNYRGLRLPDPGGLTRIGYTIKLSFPDRRDQRQLSELLDKVGLAGHEPPIGRVLALIAVERSRFLPAFLEAFDEFRRSFEGQSASRLLDHRFWAAVREAALRGRGQTWVTESAVRVSLLCEEREDLLTAFVVTDERLENPDLESLGLPFSYGDWQFALLPKGVERIEAEGLERVSLNVLEGKTRLPKISGLVEQGILPFVEGHGMLELATHDQLGEVSVALVRETLVPDLLQRFGHTALTRTSRYEGWIQVHELTLHAVPFAELDGTSLSRAWILHETLSPTSIRVVGGIRADDGYLGIHEVLPRIIVPAASCVLLEGPSGVEPLSRTRDDEWALPARDVEGEFTLLASGEGAPEDQRRIRFYAAPVSEDFKSPTEPGAWITEMTNGTDFLSNSCPFTTEPSNECFAGFCERTAYLGADVGVFVTTPKEAAWQIIHFGNRYLGQRSNLRGEAAVPTRQIANPHARRRWRKLLFESTSSGSDPGFAEACRQVKAVAVSAMALPKNEAPSLVPELRPQRFLTPSSAVERLVSVLSGRASSRAGIPWGEWSHLSQKVLNLEPQEISKVTRAWMEASLIDVASSTRWRHSSVFAQEPRLVGFQTGQHIGGSLIGLALPSTRAEVQRKALDLGAFTEDRFSISPLVPRTISLRLLSVQQLVELGKSCGLGVHWLDPRSLSFGASVRHDGMDAPPEHYERAPYSRWSLIEGNHTGVLVEHCTRRDRPAFWEASRDGRRVWSYQSNLIRAWAAALLGAPPVKAMGESFVEANHAYVPLPLARAAAILGAGLPGPTPEGPYRYPLGTTQFRDLVLDIVSRTFDPSRLVASANQLTG